MLTDDKGYYKRPDDRAFNSQYIEFIISDGLTKNGTLDWKKQSNGDYNKSVGGTWRAQPILFIGKYNINWNDFYSPDYKYCVIEI